MISIQPCALLLLVGPDWRVEAASANVAMLGDYKPASVIGQPLADLIGSKAIHSLRNRLSWLASDESEVQDFGVEWGGVTLDLRAIRNDDCHLIEAELAVEPRLPDGIGMVRSMSDRLSGHEPIALAIQATHQLAAITGFERIILSDRSGRPIAANGKMNMEPALQATELTRVIADRESEPVPLVGEDGSLLSRAAYRAPDAEECAMLESSGTTAMVSMALRIDGKFVAALHAQHSSPRRVSAERRSVARLFAERLVARMARQGFEF